MTEKRNIELRLIEPNKGQIEGLPKNPRQIKGDKFKKLVQSIKEDPEMLELREILVYPHNGKYVIIGGAMRYEALKELNLADAPCKVIDPNTSVEKLRAYTIKDNSGFGEWDWEMLANEWDEEELDRWAVETQVDFIVEDGISDEGSGSAKRLEIQSDTFIFKVGNYNISVTTHDERWQKCHKLEQMIEQGNGDELLNEILWKILSEYTL